MPFTTEQARDDYVIGSLALFLDRNVKQPYDAAVAPTVSGLTPMVVYPTPLTIREGSPDDLDVIRLAPSIAITQMNGAGTAGKAYEIGTANVWRYRSYLLSCFPSLDGNGAPCAVAKMILQSFVQTAFETECIKVVDYSNPASNASNILFCEDVMYLEKATAPIPRSMTTALAQEKHRFDIHFNVCFVVTSSLAT